MFRLYAQKHTGSYEKIGERKSQREIEQLAGRLNGKEWYQYLIIKNDGNGDEVYTRQVLSEPVKIEFVDKDPTNIEVKTKVFTPSKMKEKQKFKKEIEEWVDR